MIDNAAAETYLRMYVERHFLAGSAGRSMHGDPVHLAALALVAVDAVPWDTAASVLLDHAIASALRGRPWDLMSRRASATPGAAPPAVPRVVVVDSDVELAGGRATVHYVVLGDTQTRIEISLALNPSAAQGMRPHGPTAVLRDDSGNQVTPQFSGGGGSGHWAGCFITNQPLSRTTRWVEIDGVRIDLHDRTAPAHTSVEDLPQRDPATAFLWHHVSTARRFPPHVVPDVDSAIEALVAVGALDAASEDVAAVRGVVAALAGGTRSTPLPEPWASYLRICGRSGGPVGSIAIAAQTPPFEGGVVTVLGLTSDATGFQAHVTVSPPAAAGFGLTEQMAWWAEDDRGGVHLAAERGWSATDYGWSGEIRFDPAIDPRATRLRILPTAMRQRGVVDIELPRWNQR